MQELPCYNDVDWMMNCDHCNRDLTTKKDYAHFVVNKQMPSGQSIVFTWAYCDAMCVALAWKVVEQ